MLIMGIDPGLARVGYGIIEYKASHFTTIAHGTIETPAHTKIEDRLEMIYSQLNELITMFSPTEVAIEELFFNTNITTGIAVAQARGVILLCAKQHGLNIYEYTPLQVKQSVVGYGRADKKQVTELVKLILNLKEAPKLDDTADALAIAVCHAHTGSSKISRYYNIK